MTLREKIKATAMYQRNADFTCAEMMSTLKVEFDAETRRAVRSALQAMLDAGELVQSGEHKFCKPKRHWIHSRRLADPPRAIGPWREHHGDEAW